jgi:hypothetical protein
MTGDVIPDSIETGTRPLTSFNARGLPVRQIVDTFVEPGQFARLRRPINSLLSGPRGSGKTTMMKMLQPIALELWDSPAAEDVSSEIPYTGVFIATDRAWKRQLEPPIVEENLLGPEIRLVAEAAFTTHVLRQVVDAMTYRLSPHSRGRVKRSRARLEGGYDIKKLAANIARLVQLEYYEPSLTGIADSLTIRLSNLQGLQKSLREGRKFDIPEWVQADCLGIATAAINLFNRAVGQEDHQWALLFDEMELAPTSIVESLLKAMRGLPENVVLKLSISPVQPELFVLNLPYAGVHGQDFELIQLTYARQQNAIELGRRMLSAEAERRHFHTASAVGLLGRSVFSSFDDGGGGRTEGAARENPYAKSSELWKIFRRLEQIDPSFRNWLEQRNVDLNQLERLGPSERAATLRKVRNIVVVRESYRNASASRRSRKSYTLYTGADTVLTVCDGNPRLLTALLGQMLSDPEPTRGRVSRAVQSQAINSVIGRFFALIDSAEAVPLKNGIATLSNLVHLIGEGFADRVIEQAFNDNVALAFSVDRGVSEATLKLLRIGINMGVFVHIPRRGVDERVPLDLYGERFRLSYVLAPYFGLPIRLGPAVRLTALIRPRPSSSASRQAQSTDSVTDPGQYVLFMEPRRLPPGDEQ